MPKKLLLMLCFGFGTFLFLSQNLTNYGKVLTVELEEKQMTNYQKLYEIAADNYGLVTSVQAKEVGVSDKEMCAISKRNKIRRISYGVYKLVDYIPVKYDTYAEAVAIVDKDAFLFGESVLAMLELCPTNPTRIFVGTDKRIRKNIRKSIIIVKSTAKNITSYEGIRSQNVEVAIFECINSVRSSRLITATNNALKEGYIDKSTSEKLLARINNE